MNAVGRLDGEMEGRRGPRIDREEGAAISVSPESQSTGAPAGYHQPGATKPEAVQGYTGPDFLGHRQGSGDDATTATERET